MQMRRSRVLERLRGGHVVRSFKVNLSCARVVEIAALSGFDCIWTDREHVANDWSVIEQQVWAAKAHDADLLVRVSRGSYSDYVRALELDASGIMVPHIMNLADAREVVHQTRFHPLGRRAIDSGNADALYASLALDTYLEEANDQRFLILQIEDPEPLADLEAIAALPGVDMLFFGPADFSHGLGAPGDWNHPAITDARRRVADACRAHGKFAGTVGTPASLPGLVEMGYQFINVGADVVGLGDYCRQLLEPSGEKL
jgi:4-hydroxy-2-oxoheptanedioate aldolase